MPFERKIMLRKSFGKQLLSSSTVTGVVIRENGGKKFLLSPAILPTKIEWARESEAVCMHSEFPVGFN